MAATHSTTKTSEEDFQVMRREFKYECSITRLIYHLSGELQNNYHNVLRKTHDMVEEMYQSVLQEEDKETWFCWYLMYQIDLRKQKTLLGAVEIKDFKHIVPDFVIFCNKYTTTGPDGKLEPLEDINKEAPFWEVNDKYYKDLCIQKIRQLAQGHKMEEPEQGWTLDTWNHTKSDLYWKQLDVYNDPELQPWTIVHRRIVGEEVFYCGSVQENVVTTLFDLPQYGDTDIDVMICYPLPGTLDDECTKPGYIRIMLSEGGTTHDTDAYNYILSSCHKLNYLQTPGINQRRFMEVSGPAIGGFRNSSLMVKDMDHVVGFYDEDCAWPKVAEEWIHRERSDISGWPTKALIDRAISHGTYVVPVAHKNSNNPDIEWRYSFSRSEIDLMGSITNTQRKCYMLTKRLCKLIFSGFKIFCSYFVKTSFFWLLEEMPAVYWEWMTMNEQVDYLLDKIIAFFTGPEHFLPNYFIRTANLIDHLSRDHIATVRQNLQKLKLYCHQRLPQYILKDVCLQLINDTTEPCNKYITFPVGEDADAVRFFYVAELSQSELDSESDGASACDSDSESVM